MVLAAVHRVTLGIPVAIMVYDKRKVGEYYVIF